MSGKPTATENALKRHLWDLLIPGSAGVGTENRGGGNIPFYKRQNEVEWLLVERFFPEKMVVRGWLRDSLAESVVTGKLPDQVYAHIISPTPITTHYISDLMPLDDGGTTEEDPILHINSYIPANKYMGIVQAIKGNPINDYIFMGFVHMTDDIDLTEDVS